MGVIEEHPQCCYDCSMAIPPCESLKEISEIDEYVKLEQTARDGLWCNDSVVSFHPVWYRGHSVRGRAASQHSLILRCRFPCMPWSSTGTDQTRRFGFDRYSSLLLIILFSIKQSSQTAPPYFDECDLEQIDRYLSIDCIFSLFSFDGKSIWGALSSSVNILLLRLLFNVSLPPNITAIALIFAELMRVNISLCSPRFV